MCRQPGLSPWNVNGPIALGVTQDTSRQSLLRPGLSDVLISLHPAVDELPCGQMKHNQVSALGIPNPNIIVLASRDPVHEHLTGETLRNFDRMGLTPCIDVNPMFPVVRIPVDMSQTGSVPSLILGSVFEARRVWLPFAWRKLGPIMNDELPYRNAEPTTDDHHAPLVP